MEISQNQAYGAVSAETAFQERGNAHMSGATVSNAQGNNDNHDDDNEYFDMTVQYYGVHACI
jgi:hypothetical protein